MDTAPQSILWDSCSSDILRSEAGSYATMSLGPHRSKDHHLLTLDHQRQEPLASRVQRTNGCSLMSPATMICHIVLQKTGTQLLTVHASSSSLQKRRAGHLASYCHASGFKLPNICYFSGCRQIHHHRVCGKRCILRSRRAAMPLDMVPAARVCASAFSPMASVMSEKVLPASIVFINT